MDSTYSDDPRVTIFDGDAAMVETDQGDVTVVQDHGSGSWYAIDEAGELLAATADGKQTGDDAIHAVIGDPIWVAEGDLITEAAERTGWFEANHLNTPSRQTAMDFLVATGVFMVDGQPGQVMLCVLTQAGIDLAVALADRSDAAIKQVLDERRAALQPQQ